MERINEDPSYLAVLKISNLEKENRRRYKFVYPRTDFNSVQPSKLIRIIR